MLRKVAIAQSIFFTAAAILVLSSLSLMIFIGGRGLSVFGKISPAEFFFGTEWNQNTPVFGVLPLLYGSILTALVTLLISAPLAILVAVFMVEVAPAPIRRVMRTTVELFASLPSVIYGLLGLTIVVPWVRDIFHAGLGKGILAAALVLVFMTQPTMVTITEDALRRLPDSLREAARGIGATRWQMIWGVLLPAARQGIITAIILGMGRAVGETMAVQMVIGNITARIPKDLVTGATTMPAAIVTQLPEATSAAHKDALIMVGFLLLCITFILISLVRLTSGDSKKQPRRKITRPVTTGSGAPEITRQGSEA